MESLSFACSLKNISYNIILLAKTVLKTWEWGLALTVSMKGYVRVTLFQNLWG